MTIAPDAILQVKEVEVPSAKDRKRARFEYPLKHSTSVVDLCVRSLFERHPSLIYSVRIVQRNMGHKVPDAVHQRLDHSSIRDSSQKSSRPWMWKRLLVYMLCAAVSRALLFHTSSLFCFRCSKPLFDGAVGFHRDRDGFVRRPTED